MSDAEVYPGKWCICFLKQAEENHSRLTMVLARKVSGTTSQVIAYGALSFMSRVRAAQLFDFEKYCSDEEDKELQDLTAGYDDERCRILHKQIDLRLRGPARID